MRRCLPFVFCLALSACSRMSPTSTGQTPPSTPPGRTVSEQFSTGEFELGQPVRHQNLTVFPVLSKAKHDEDRFITLEEGLQAGTVEVVEVGAVRAAAALSCPSAPDSATAPTSVLQEVATENSFANEVNRLMVINKSDKPLYLMPGEVIVGGSQDRTIAEEAIIAATGKPVPIDVYCVEHGRWALRAAESSTALYSTLAVDSSDAGDLAAEAAKGKFVAQAGHLNKSSRLAANAREGQQKVWDEVAKANAVSQVSWDSGAFTANYVDQNVLQQLQPYQEALASVADQERVVGVIVSINGKPETADVFESTPLFRKFWPKLLKGYSLDARHAAESEESQKLCSTEDAHTFLDSILAGQAQNEKPTTGGLVVSRRENPSSVSFSAGNPAPADAAPGAIGGGGFGGAVHASGFAK